METFFLRLVKFDPAPPAPPPFPPLASAADRYASDVTAQLNTICNANDAKTVEKISINTLRSGLSWSAIQKLTPLHVWAGLNGVGAGGRQSSFRRGRVGSKRFLAEQAGRADCSRDWQRTFPGQVHVFSSFFFPYLN